MYSTEQIPTLNKIIFLRDIGFTVAEIALALSQWDETYILKLLEQKHIAIEETIQEEQAKLSKIQLAKKDILTEKAAIHYNVAIKAIPSYEVLSLRKVILDYYAEGELWREMSAFAKNNGIVVSDKTFSIYHDPEYKETEVDVEICAPVKLMGESKNGFVFRNTEPIPIMACTMVYGPFQNIAGAYLALANWLNEHNQYKMTGQSRQIVHRGPWNEEEPDKYLTEIQIPLKKPM